MSRVYHRAHVTFVIKGMRCRDYLIHNGDLISFIYKPIDDCVYM